MGGCSETHGLFLPGGAVDRADILGLGNVFLITGATCRFIRGADGDLVKGDGAL